MRSRFTAMAGRLAALATTAALAMSAGCSVIVDSVLSEGSGEDDGGTADARPDGPPSGSEICNNGVDDDGDGFTDCKDTDCATEPTCITDCVTSVGGSDDPCVGCICGSGCAPYMARCQDEQCLMTFWACLGEERSCQPNPECLSGVDPDLAQRVGELLRCVCARGETECQEACRPETDCGDIRGPQYCCTDEMDNEEDGTSDCDDPDCGAFCTCEAWLPEPVAGTNPPAEAIGVDFQCQCGMCWEAWEACLAGEDGTPGTDDDPEPGWCLAAAVCRSDRTNGGPSDLPLGCGRLDRDRPAAGTFSPNACPTELMGTDWDLTAAADDLAMKAQEGNAIARRLLGLEGSGRAVATCLCRSALDCGGGR